MLCPVAAVVGAIQIQERDSMNIADAEIGKAVRDKDGTAWRVVGLDYEGLPLKKGPLVVVCGPRGIVHQHLNQREFAEFVRVATEAEATESETDNA